MTKRTPTYEELAEFARWTMTVQPNALNIMRHHGYVLDNLDDRMQKLAFTFYTDLCEIDMKARQLFGEELWKEGEKDGDTVPR